MVSLQPNKSTVCSGSSRASSKVLTRLLSGLAIGCGLQRFDSVDQFIGLDDTRQTSDAAQNAGALLGRHFALAEGREDRTTGFGQTAGQRERDGAIQRLQGRQGTIHDEFGRSRVTCLCLRDETIHDPRQIVADLLAKGRFSVGAARSAAGVAGFTFLKLHRVFLCCFWARSEGALVGRLCL
ncbi:hypothetical protein [Thiocapsa sp. UBA6158]|uniref:hypothetical protein n=1 Tax=Thiocapsa sp. UBA6158 TaxID=1947692 RepID=UPI003BEEB749